jgi:putative ABC transport system permease protein
MRMLRRVSAFVRGIARRREIATELDEELQFHIEQAAEEHARRGVQPDEARRLALAELGGVTAITESVRDVRTLRLELVWRDVREAARSLRNSPTFSMVALAVLALSIGATTAIFTVVDAVVLRPLPFDDPEGLVVVGERHKQEDAAALHRTTPQTFLDWRERQDVLAGMAAVAYAEISVQGHGDVLPRNLRAQRITADFFRVLRVAPVRGRAFTAADEEPGQGPIAIISYDLWQQQFGGRADVIGARLQGPRASFEVVGVMPAEFVYPIDTYLLGGRESVDVWVPYIVSSTDRVRGTDYGYNLHVVGRLREGEPFERAAMRMRQLTDVLATETPRWFEDRELTFEPLHAFMTRRVRSWMLLLLGAVSCVLLIASVNLASLMLVRATTRTRELSIRTALGASRWALARRMIVEALLLSFTGAAIGALAAWWGVEALKSTIPTDVPRVAAISIDVRVLAMTIVVALATGVAFGVVPVLQLVWPTNRRALQQGERLSTSGPRADRLRSALVVTEVAVAVVLLVGAGLFLASFARVSAVRLGLSVENVHALQIRLAELPDEPERAARRNRELLLRVLTRVQSLPGVENAAIVSGGVPLRGDLRTADFAIPGRALAPNADIDLNQVSPEYFDTLRVPMLRGRAFTRDDVEGGAPVVILNRAAATRYFGLDEAIGQRVQVAGDRTVIGVVEDVRHDGPESDWRSQAFVPITQTRVFGGTLVVRMAEGARDVVPQIRDAIATEFVGLPVRVDEGTLAEYLNRLIERRRFTMLIVGLFGALGLAIAAIGVYGVMAYTVTQRTQEIGIRVALGAVPSLILRSVLASAATRILAGLGIGLLVSWSVAPRVRGFLFGTAPGDPTVYVGVVVVLVVVGLAAAIVPARRAARVDPVVALRTE